MDTFLRIDMAVKKHMMPWPLLYIADRIEFIYNIVDIFFR